MPERWLNEVDQGQIKPQRLIADQRAVDLCVGGRRARLGTPVARFEMRYST